MFVSSLQHPKKTFQIFDLFFSSFFYHLGIKNMRIVFILGVCIAETSLRNISPGFFENLKKGGFYGHLTKQFSKNIDTKEPKH